MPLVRYKVFSATSVPRKLWKVLILQHNWPQGGWVHSAVIYRHDAGPSEATATATATPLRLILRAWPTAEAGIHTLGCGELQEQSGACPWRPRIRTPNPNQKHIDPLSFLQMPPDPAPAQLSAWSQGTRNVPGGSECVDTQPELGTGYGLGYAYHIRPPFPASA
ncbi:hypothetical protein TREES_T100017132 [Tupaia chinensis]|uniref:Uncharacterized protein n=1 Tax=Tupaia chinensis TaxID=246437 RepID=L9KJB7_TUPCH|nr:hypothetical protein TREES_T100017132 [Tupaia chinensis]